MSLTGAGGGSTNDEARSEERTQIRTRETVTGSVGDDNNEGGAAPSRPAEDSNVNNDYLARNDVADRQERNHDQPNEMMQRAVAEPNICVICQDDMSNQQRIMRVECGVSFHEECILTWLRTNHSVTCPCCRRTHWAGNQNNETCSICRGPIPEGYLTMRAECGLVFHQVCMVRNLRRNPYYFCLNCQSRHWEVRRVKVLQRS